MGDTVEHRLGWVRPDAPYSAVATVGLLACLDDRDRGATAHWEPSPDGMRAPCLVIRTALDLPAVSEAIAEAPWPDVDGLDWPAKRSQAIKPTLSTLAGDSPIPAVRAWRELAGLDDSPGADDPAEQTAARRLVAALLTDGTLDGGLPGRSRLLRGVKADLSGTAKPPKTTADELAVELAGGPAWTSGSSGLGLGLVPEVQTFGGTTGPNPQSVGQYSKLLYRLCWHGLMAMPPFAVDRGSRRVVGGPLFSGADTLSWTDWTFPLRRNALVPLFGLAAIHADEPDGHLLRARGISAVFRSKAREINTMISVFGWGARVA